MNTDKILDDAREKIALVYLAKEYGLSVDAIKQCIKDNKIRENHITEAHKLADQILALSGTTDIECPDEATGDPDFATKTRYKWKVGVHLENGKLPEVKEDYPFEREETQLDMLNEGWVKEVRQVVEKKEESNGKSSSNH